MPADSGSRSHQVAVSEETLLLLNASTVVRQSVRTAAHELNNALQLVSGSAEMLALMPDLPSRARSRVDTILRHIGRCQAIVEGIAGVARAEPAAEQPVNVAQVIEHVLEMRRYEHTRAGIEVTLARGDTLPVMVRAVPRHLEQILLAMILNAEQAVGRQPGRAVVVTVERTNDEAIVTVRDNGVGLASCAGDPFAPFTTTKAAAGLGLFAARTLAERHGGTLTLESPPVQGHGTTAVLRLVPVR